MWGKVSRPSRAEQRNKNGLTFRQRCPFQETVFVAALFFVPASTLPRGQGRSLVPTNNNGTAAVYRRGPRILLTINPFLLTIKNPSVNKLMLFYQAFSRFVDDVDDFSGCAGFRQQTEKRDGGRPRGPPPPPYSAR
ncbi:MAG: hypothetical protein ACOX8R_10445 [Bacillota bacterium]